MRNVGEHIADLREKRGFSINALAERAGISQSHLTNIENSKRNPTVAVLTEICSALDISMEEFFQDSGEDLFTSSIAAEAKRLTYEQRVQLLHFLKTL